MATFSGNNKKVWSKSKLCQIPQFTAKWYFNMAQCHGMAATRAVFTQLPWHKAVKTMGSLCFPNKVNLHFFQKLTTRNIYSLLRCFRSARPKTINWLRIKAFRIERLSTTLKFVGAQKSFRAWELLRMMVNKSKCLSNQTTPQSKVYCLQIKRYLLVWLTIRRWPATTKHLQNL